MFLQLAHTKLDAFLVSKQLVLECYKATKNFPPEEKFGLIQQIRRAVLSVHLNIAEGCSRKSIQERKRFFEISRGSLVEVDAAFDVAKELKYCTYENISDSGNYLVQTFKILSGMIGGKGSNH